jgi:MFS transporter, DHA1 family, tetracycline resistance protein
VKREPIPRGFWPVWTSVAVDLLGFGIIIPLLPLYAERFGAGPMTIGILFASYSLAQFVASPIWGRMSDRVGRRPILLVTIAGSAVGSLTLGLAGSLPMLFVGRIIDGASGASIAVARATVADMATPSMRPRLMGLLGAAFGVGFVVGPLIGALASLGSPSLPFFVAAAISIGNLIVARRRVSETRTESSSPTTERPGRGLPSTAVRLIALTFVGVTAFGAFEATFSLLGSSRLGMTESAVAMAFAGVGVVLVLAQVFVVGKAAAVLGEPGVLRLALALNAAGFGILAFASAPGSLASGVILLALGQGLLTATLASALAGAMPTRSGAALGAQQSAAGLARVVGPLLGGALFAVATPIPYVVSALLTLAALVLVPNLAGPTSNPRVPG